MFGSFFKNLLAKIKSPKSKSFKLKFSNGKVIGPLSKKEIFKKIDNGEIIGVEKIYPFGSDAWVEIKSHNLFEDRINSLFYKSSNLKNDYYSGTQTYSQKDTKILSSDKSDVTLDVKDHPSKPKKKLNLRPIILFIALLALGLILYQFLLAPPEGENQNTQSKRSNKINYVNNKVVGLMINSEQVFSKKLLDSEFVEQEESGFGLWYWLEEINAEKDKVNPWIFYWIDSSLGLMDKSKLKNYQIINQSISKVKQAVNEGGLSNIYHLGITSFIKGDWQKAQESFIQFDTQETRWLAQICYWLDFWQNGGKSDLLFSSISSQVLSSEYRFSSGLIESFFEKEPEYFINNLTNYIDVNAQSPLIWWAAAEWHWRVGGENVQLANQFFILALASSNYWPLSVQKVLWLEFSRFLKTFGRKSISKKALNNSNIIANRLDGQTKYKGSWWNINAEYFKLSEIAEDSLSKINSANISNKDLGVLQVVAPFVDKKPNYFIEVGDYFSFRKEFNKAISYYKNALQIEPTNSQALGGLVWGYSSLFNFSEAFNYLDRFDKDEKAFKKKLKYKALLLGLGREYENSYSTFDNYMVENPTDSWGHYFYALVALDKKDYRKCIQESNLAKINSSGQMKKWSQLLMINCRTKSGYRRNLAIEEIKDLQARNKSSVDYAVSLIYAYLDSDMASQAKDFAIEAKKNFPYSYSIRLALADVFLAQGLENEAILLFQRAAELNKNKAKPFMKIGNIFYKRGSYNQAANNFMMAANRQSEYPETYLRAARSYKEAGETLKAVQAYEFEIRRRPSVISTFVEMAQFLLSKGAPEEVIKLFDKYKANYQDSISAILIISQCYFFIKNSEQAIANAQKVLSYDRENFEAHRILGLSYLRLKQYSLAKRHLSKYLQLNPVAPDAEEIKKNLAKIRNY